MPLYVRLDDLYLETNGYPLRLFRSAWNRLAAQDAQRRRAAQSDAAVQRTNDYLRQLRENR